MTGLSTRRAASRKGWVSRKAREAASAHLLAGGTLPAPPRGIARLDPEDSDPGVLMRRAIDSLKAREAAE